MVLGFSSAILLILILVLVAEWLTSLPSTQQAAEIWQKESVQQGTVTWEFDANDPLLEQRTILINTWINEMTTQKVITLLAYLNEKDRDTPITIILSSNGGYTKDAYAIVHAIRESPCIVNTVALGDCFSACTKILMGGTGDRKIAPDSRLAIHTHTYPDDGYLYSKNTILFQRENEFFQDYSEIPPEWISNREERFYYMTPEQAVTYKIVDAILE
jgi:ATP-dependent protease ClpP protease subunit